MKIKDAEKILKFATIAFVAILLFLCLAGKVPPKKSNEGRIGLVEDVYLAIRNKK